MNSRLWILAALLLIILGCSAAPHPETAPAPAPATQETTKQSGTAAAGEFIETGIASWYGEEFHGKETSNGETYDMFKLTAAHQTLPFHTLVEITNLENNRKVLVRINDRGPFVKGRIIDLSYKAARELGMGDTGTARVSLRIVQYASSPLGEEEPTRVVYFLQAGAFQVYENARELLDKLQSEKAPLRFSVWKEGDLFKVFSERTPQKALLEEIQRSLARGGIPTFIREIH